MTLGEQIAKRRRARRMSQTELGEAVGVGQTTISKWETGKSEPSQAEIARLADVLGAIETIALHDQEKLGMVPVMGYVDQALSVITTNGSSLEYIEAPLGTPDGAQAVVVRGSSFPPFKDGSALFFWAWADNPEVYLGELCIVELAAGGFVIREIERGSEPGTWTLPPYTGAPSLRNVRVKRVALIEGHVRKPRWINRPS